LRLRGFPLDRVKAMYCDPASPGDTRVLSDLTRIQSASPGALSVQDRLEWMRRKLKMYPGTDLNDPPMVPHLTMNPSCTNMRREFDAYKYPETHESAAEKDKHAPENPEKKNDHTPEALGRLFSGMFGSPWTQRAATQRRAKVGSGRRRR